MAADSTPKKAVRDLLYGALLATLSAGESIMEVYASGFDVQYKTDQSPLTEADERSHEILSSRLDGGIPILSEEGMSIPFEERNSWDLYWLIDPLDGTKEFIKGNGEFTVNVALMEFGRPLAGIVFLPAKDRLYWCSPGDGAFRAMGEAIGEIKHATAGDVQPQIASVLHYSTPIRSENRRHPSDSMKVVQSVSHVSAEEAAFIQSLRPAIGDFDTAAAGSSLKFCLVAEGSADVYPRFGPTMEWDTAAGHCIAEAAGCDVLDIASGSRCEYNKRELRNSPFVVLGPRLSRGSFWRDAVLSCAKSCLTKTQKA